jgi:uncharacterized protein
VRNQLQNTQLITTELVLIEFLNYFCSYGAQTRQVGANTVRAILRNRNMEVILHTHELFLMGLALYVERLDKGYSLTDCISMVVMREKNLTDVLTHDRHFIQEGFTILL